MSLPYKQLPDGAKIPIIGFGTGSLWFKEPDSPPFDQNTVNAVELALKLGFVHLDTAEKYGTESEVGVAILHSQRARHELFVTTKVLAGVGDAASALDRSLERLGLDYVDLFLVHEPFWAKNALELQAVWRTMEQVKASGKAKSIGVSNFGQEHIQAILEIAHEPPAINQIELNPYLQQRDLLAFLANHNIAVAAYAPLTPLVRAAPGPIDETLERLSGKYSVSPAAILLRWSLAQGFVVVSTSDKELELRDYKQAFEIGLTADEIEALSKEGSAKHYRSFYNDIYAA